MQVVNHYLYLPGSCLFCRSSNLPVIDTGQDLDWPNDPNSPNPSANTRLYICADCGIELARMVMDTRGLTIVKDDVIPELKSTIDALSKNNVDLAQRNEDLENTMRILATVPPQPQESPAKKTFKVVGSLEGETEV
jgi:hypothetical protein